MSIESKTDTAATEGVLERTQAITAETRLEDVYAKALRYPRPHTVWLWHGPGRKTQPEELTLKMESNTDTIQSPARCQQPIVLPLSHDRDEFGDWGWIRDQTGAIVYEAKIPQGSDLTEHRRNKTDPSQARVDALLQAFEIVQRLAEWSAKYPRQQVHSFSAKVDQQLIEIENAAKAWLDGQNDQRQATTSK